MCVCVFAYWCGVSLSTCSSFVVCLSQFAVNYYWCVSLCSIFNPASGTVSMPDESALCSAFPALLMQGPWVGCKKRLYTLFDHIKIWLVAHKGTASMLFGSEDEIHWLRWSFAEFSRFHIRFDLLLFVCFVCCDSLVSAVRWLILGF